VSNLMNTVHSYGLLIKGHYGEHLIAENGLMYYDFWGDEGVNSLPYDTVSRIIAEHIFANEPIHVPKMYLSKYREMFAKSLVRFTKIDGWGIRKDDGKVFFSNSGTEANEAAIKLARLYWYKLNSPYRWNIAVMKGNFHGRTGFSLAASDSSDSPYHKLGFGPMPAGFYHFETIGELYGLSKIPGGLAAVMMAPVLGNNCIKVYDYELFAGLQIFRNDTGTLIIFDEVQVAMGRTGKNMAFHHQDLTPDIVTVGKGIASGFPLSATVARKEVAEVFTPGSHFNTFGGNELACKIGLHVVDYIDNNLERIAKLGKHIRESLGELYFIKYVTGLGIHNAFQIDFDNVPYDGYEFCKKAFENNLLICTHRRHGEIRFTPPISVSQKVVDEAIEMLVKTNKDLVG